MQSKAFNYIANIAAALIFTQILIGCASEVVLHGFEFNMLRDDQDAEVLDYRYGNSKIPVFPTVDEVKAGKVFNGNGVMGYMSREDFLYVKWRNKLSGKIYEDNVDLRFRLPRDITHHKIYFMIRDAQLYVYLITPNIRHPDTPAIGPAMFQSRQIVQIYPDLRG